MMVACPAAAQVAPSGLSGVRGSARSLRGQTAEHLNSAGAVTSARGLGGRVIKEVPCEPPLEDECVHRRSAGVARGDPPRCVGRGFTEMVTEAWQMPGSLGEAGAGGRGRRGGLVSEGRGTVGDGARTSHACAVWTPRLGRSGEPGLCYLGVLQRRERVVLCARDYWRVSVEHPRRGPFGS